MAKTETSGQKIMSLLKALVLSFAATALLLLLLALLLYKLELKESPVMVGIALTYLISCFVGGLFAGHCIRERRFLWGMATGGVYFLLLLGISAVSQQSVVSDWKSVAAAFLLCCGGGMLGGMVS